MLEIRISDPAALSREEANAVILMLQTLADGTPLAITVAGPTETKEAHAAPLVPPPATVVLCTAVAEAPPIAPEASTVFSQAPTNVVPLPSAPANVAPPAPPLPAGSVELDNRGLPWDGRIHASTRAKLQDGSWRQKRGTDAAYVTQVENELRAAQGAPAAPVPPAPTVPVAAVPAPPPTGAPAAPAAPVGGAIGASPSSFAALLTAASAAIAAGTLTQAGVLEACQAVGVPTLPALAARPDLVPSVATMLGL